MLKPILVSSAVLFALTSSYAGAYSVVTTTAHTGVISAINTQEKSMSVIEKNMVKTYVLSHDAKIVASTGKVLDMKHLQKGQTIAFKETTTTPVDAELKGEVLTINPSSSVMKIQSDTSGKIMTVKFDANTRFSGYEVSSLSHVKKGSTVVVTSTAK